MEMAQVVFLISGVISFIIVLFSIYKCKNYISVDALCTNMNFTSICAGGVFFTVGKGTFVYNVDGKEYVYEDQAFVNGSKQKKE